MRAPAGLMAAGFVAVLLACGGSDGQPAAPAQPPRPARSIITVSFNPDPVVAIPSGDPARPFRASYLMTIRETAGLAANVNFWNETLQNPITGLESTTLNFGADAVIRAAGTNRLEPNGMLSISRNFNYSPGGTAGTGRSVIMKVVVQVGDDNGNVINTQAQLNILA